MSALLQVRGLRKAVGGVQAVQDVDFDLAAGELLAMIGPNGAGKSTCFNMINGQLVPDAGSVVLAGREIAMAIQRTNEGGFRTAFRMAGKDLLYVTIGLLVSMGLAFASNDAFVSDLLGR